MTTRSPRTLDELGGARRTCQATYDGAHVLRLVEHDASAVPSGHSGRAGRLPPGACTRLATNGCTLYSAGHGHRVLCMLASLAMTRGLARSLVAAVSSLYCYWLVRGMRRLSAVVTTSETSHRTCSLPYVQQPLDTTVRTSICRYRYTILRMPTSLV